MFLELDLKLNDSHLIEVYQASLLHKLINHNVALRIDSLYVVEIMRWLPSHELKFNQINIDVERSIKCAANECRHKTYKKHKWTHEYNRGIYCIILYWRLRLKTLDNINTTNDSAETLPFYATKSCLTIYDSRIITVDTCLLGIKSTRSSINVEIKQQLHAKDQYQYHLASGIIERKYRHLSPDVSLSDKLERDDLIDRKLKHMSEATARINLFTLIKFDIKGFIDPYSIKNNDLTRVDVTINNQTAPLTTKNEI
jgi:hypothetical protein